MTTMTNNSGRSLVAERPVVETLVTEGPMRDVPAAEGAEAGAPNFHVGVGRRVMMASAGITLLAAAALVIYGQLSPGI